MASQTFVIAGETMRKDICVRYLLGAVILLLLIVAAFVGFYVFKGNNESVSANGCKNPELDPFGMSNWTLGSDTVAFGCFPGHDLEGHHDNLPIVSECINKQWVPAPPACLMNGVDYTRAALPMRLDCNVEHNGIEGTVMMWQESDTTPTFLYGHFNLSAIDRSKPQHSESITISRSTCTSSTDMNISFPSMESTGAADNTNLSIFEVRVNTTELQAYKKTTLRIDVIILDTSRNITLPLVFITQGDVTLMVKSQIPAKIPQVGNGSAGDGLIEGSSGLGDGLIEGHTTRTSTQPPTILTFNDSLGETEATTSEPLPEASN